MRSKTSLFNKTLVGQTAFKRFWPIMAVYALILLFVVFLSVIAMANSIDGGSLDWHADDIASLQASVLIVTRVGGGIFALLLGIVLAKIGFGYLNQSNTTQFYHALPVKRATLFWSHYLSGILLFAIPILFAWLVAWIMILAFGLAPLLAAVMLPVLGVMLATHFFFYAFAVLIGFLTGHGAAHVVIYAVFNFLSMFIYVMLEMLFGTYLYGFVGMGMSTFGIPPVFTWLSPIVGFCQDAAMPWGYVIYPLIGVGFTLLALLLYKRRKLEVAGNVIAVEALRPVFTIGFAVCFSLLFALFMSVFFMELSDMDKRIGTSVTLLVFSFVGYYVARMLIKRTFKVFGKSLRGVLIFMAAVVLGVSTLQFDLTGFETRIPREEDVEFVVCAPQNYIVGDSYNARYVALGSGRVGAYQFDGVPKERLDPLTGDLALLAREHAPGVFEERENIHQTALLHQWITENRNDLRDPNYDYSSNYIEQKSFNITYQMKDGSQVFRRYQIHAQVTLPPAVETLYNSDEYRIKYYLYPGIEAADAKDAQIVNGNARYTRDEYAHINELLYKTENDAASLLDAIVKDVRAGNVGLYYPSPEGAFEREVSTVSAYVRISLPRNSLTYLLGYYGYGDRTRIDADVGVYITTRAENILKWMEDHEIDTSPVFEQRMQGNDLIRWYEDYTREYGSKSFIYPETVGKEYPVAAE